MTKGSVLPGNKTAFKVYAPNNSASKYRRPKLIEPQGEMDQASYKQSTSTTGHKLSLPFLPGTAGLLEKN